MKLSINVQLLNCTICFTTDFLFIYQHTNTQIVCLAYHEHHIKPPKQYKSRNNNERQFDYIF